MEIKSLLCLLIVGLTVNSSQAGRESIFPCLVSLRFWFVLYPTSLLGLDLLLTADAESCCRKPIFWLNVFEILTEWCLPKTWVCQNNRRENMSLPSKRTHKNKSHGWFTKCISSLLLKTFLPSTFDVFYLASCKHFAILCWAFIAFPVKGSDVGEMAPSRR